MQHELMWSDCCILTKWQLRKFDCPQLVWADRTTTVTTCDVCCSSWAVSKIQYHDTMPDSCTSEHREGRNWMSVGSVATKGRRGPGRWAQVIQQHLELANNDTYAMFRKKWYICFFHIFLTVFGQILWKFQWVSVSEAVNWQSFDFDRIC